MMLTVAKRSRATNPAINITRENAHMGMGVNLNINAWHVISSVMEPITVKSLMQETGSNQDREGDKFVKKERKQ